MSKQIVRKDMVIIGAGMAGLTAALYAGRMKLDVLVLENAIVGGQIVNSARIENYPGAPDIEGGALMAALQEQAESFGAEVDEFDAIQSTQLGDELKRIETDTAIYETPVVIIAAGMRHRPLPLPEAAKYEGKGIHYCELCDGHQYQDKIIAVAGGGNAAADAAVFLSKYAKKLYVIHRSELRADAVTQKRLYDLPSAEILLHTEITALQGEEKLEQAVLWDKSADKKYNLPVDAIFVNIGSMPNDDTFKGQVAADAYGHLIAGEDCRTNVAGVFAAGDIRTKEIRQLTTAAADGTIAALLAEKYIRQMKEEGKW